MFATTAFIHGALDFFLILAGTLLNAPDQFVFLAFGELHRVVGELRKFLFQLALGDVPVSFGGKCGHIISRLIISFYAARLVALSWLSFASGVPTRSAEKLSPQIQLFEGSKNFLEGKCNYCSQKNLQIAKEVFTKLADCIVLKRLAIKQLL
jgi:hypothetical protein